MRAGGITATVERGATVLGKVITGGSKLGVDVFKLGAVDRLENLTASSTKPDVDASTPVVEDV